MADRSDSGIVVAARREQANYLEAQSYRVAQQAYDLRVLSDRLTEEAAELRRQADEIEAAADGR